MKKSLTNLILEKVAEVGEATFDVFFPPQYAFTQFSRNLFGIDSNPRVTPQTLSTTLSRLKQEGLVTRSGNHKSSVWRITNKGQYHIRSRQSAHWEVPPPDGILRLVTFDIPEGERRKRDELRSHLVTCNFKQLQKSVWVGYNPLPEDFIQFLDTYQLKEKVHILRMEKGGTITASS